MPKEPGLRLSLAVSERVLLALIGLVSLLLEAFPEGVSLHNPGGRHPSGLTSFHDTLSWLSTVKSLSALTPVPPIATVRGFRGFLP